MGAAGCADGGGQRPRGAACTCRGRTSQDQTRASAVPHPAHNPTAKDAEHGASAPRRYQFKHAALFDGRLPKIWFAQAGKIFDFNLTLPLMAGQFLLLMVFLDKTWFGPVGKLLEDRDAELRSKLGAFRDNRCATSATQQRNSETVGVMQDELGNADDSRTLASRAEVPVSFRNILYSIRVQPMLEYC